MTEQNKRPVQRQNAKVSTRTPSNKPASRPVGKPVSSKPIATKSSNNLYKKGKLSKNARFSPRKIKWTPIIILVCVLFAFVLAIIFGNYLSDKVENSQNTTPPLSDSTEIVPPKADKVNPYNELHAYFADLSGADPEKSLSELTSDARSKGNALLVNMRNAQGEIMYSSDKAKELGFACKENLTLSRLNNHFEYYDDFAVGFFSSDFKSTLDTEKALELQNKEILLLKEATDIAFDQIIIEFSGSITKGNAIYYQAYLLNLKLACSSTPIGIKLSPSFLSDTANAGAIAGLLGIADFFVLDFETRGVEDIKNSLAPVVYFTERYDCVVMISESDEALVAEKVSAIEDSGIKNYIVE